MKLMLIGCEYSGTTTLALAVNNWAKKALGRDFGIIHDHWKIPHISGHEPTESSLFLTEMEQQQILALSPRIKQSTQRHSLSYHTPSVPNDRNVMNVGHMFDDSIYGSLYFEYERLISHADRSNFIRHLETQVIKNAPETVLVLLRASPDIIRRRMKEKPHPRGVLLEKDIESVLDSFQYEFSHTMFEHKFDIDTSTSTMDEILAEFVDKIEPHLTESDRSRMAVRQMRICDGTG